jgi:hypothetical protein
MCLPSLAAKGHADNPAVLLLQGRLLNIEPVVLGIQGGIAEHVQETPRRQLSLGSDPVEGGNIIPRLICIHMSQERATAPSHDTAELPVESRQLPAKRLLQLVETPAGGPPDPITVPGGVTLQERQQLIHGSAALLVVLAEHLGEQGLASVARRLADAYPMAYNSFIPLMSSTTP